MVHHSITSFSTMKMPLRILEKIFPTGVSDRLQLDSELHRIRATDVGLPVPTASRPAKSRLPGRPEVARWLRSGEEGGEKRGEKKEKKKRKEEKKRRLHELSFQGISEDNIKINAQTVFNIAFSSIDSKQQSIEDAEGDLLEKTHETTAIPT